MKTELPAVGIVLLNWNGWRDTIACLESLYRQDYPNFSVAIVDNGSTDDSVERISAWVREFHSKTDVGREIPFRRMSHGGKHSTPALTLEDVTEMQTKVASGSRALFLVQSAENLGFAAGCNLGMRICVTVGCDYLWMLNNDTEVAEDALRKMVLFLEGSTSYAAATGQIRYHGKPEVIWNCGGRLLPLGLRRYDYCGAPASQVPKSGHSRITFMTGCAALFRAELMEQVGFLSERFFFGEEDFELCHRLKRQGHVMACCYDAVIFHKVGVSIGTASAKNALAKAHIHYLNRFVHMRTHWNYLFWQFWRYSYCVYIVLMLRRTRFAPVRSSLTMLRSVLNESSRLDAVDGETFRYVMKRTYTR